jgi:hypothetical protein
MISLKRSISYLESGLPVREILWSMRGIEAELEAFLGKDSVPRCLIEYDLEGPDLTLTTSLPGLGNLQLQLISRVITESEDRRLRDHLLKVLRAWEREVELKESPLLKSISEAKKAIAELFGFAGTVFNRLRMIESFRVETFEFTTLSISEGSPTSPARSTKKRSQESEELERSKRKRVEELKARGGSISKELIFLEKDREILQDRFRPISEILSLACRELGDAPGGSRTGILDLASVAEKVSLWGIAVRRLCEESFLRRIPLEIPFDDLTRKAFEEIESFPLTPDLETKLRRRLLDEEALTKEKLVERAELWGLSSPKAVAPVKAKPGRVQTLQERVQEAKLIAFLEEFEDWKGSQESKTGRKRLAPKDWLSERTGWSRKSEKLFADRCRELNSTAEEIVDLTIGAARKARGRRNKRQQSED